MIRNGVDLSRYALAAKNQALVNQYDLAGKFVVSYIGTHGAAHGLKNVILAAEQLRDQDTIVFMLVGDGAEKPRLVELAGEKKLQNVIFVDPKPKSEIASYWALSDLALIHLKNDPVFSEVIPSKIFEAMAMGLPILFVGPRGEASEIIEQAQVGRTILSDDPMTLVSTIKKMCNNPEERREFSKAALAQVGKFTREKQAMDMLRVFKGVLPAVLTESRA